MREEIPKLSGKSLNRSENSVNASINKTQEIIEELRQERLEKERLEEEQLEEEQLEAFNNAETSN